MFIETSLSTKKKFRNQIFFSMTFSYEVNVNELGFCVFVFYNDKMYCVASSKTQKYILVPENMQYNDKWGIFYTHFVNQGRFDDESRPISQTEFDEYTDKQEKEGIGVNCCNGNVWRIVQHIHNGARLPKDLECVVINVCSLMTTKKTTNERKRKPSVSWLPSAYKFCFDSTFSESTFSESTFSESTFSESTSKTPNTPTTLHKNMAEPESTYLSSNKRKKCVLF